MSFSRIAAVTMVASAALLAPAAPANAQTLPTASEVIAKYITAIGGKDAIMKITSISSTGTLEAPAMGLSATMEVAMAAPNKMSSKTNIPGMGEMLQGFDGTVAWDINPMAGPRVLADKELTQMKENSDFYANLLYSPERFSKMEVKGIEDFNGEKAYKLFLVRTSGTEMTQYFSVASGLAIGGETTQVTQMGPMTIQQSMGGYKQFGPIMMPTRVEQTMGPNKMIITTSDVKVNAVPATAFDMPAGIKALVKP